MLSSSTPPSKPRLGSSSDASRLKLCRNVNRTKLDSVAEIARYVEVLVADSVRVIDPRGIGRRIIGRGRHPGIRRLPQNTVGIDPIRRRPSGRQSRRRHVIEVFVQDSDQLAIAWRRCRGCRGKDVDPAPSIHVVWRACVAALGRRDNMGCVIQDRAAASQFGSATPDGPTRATPLHRQYAESPWKCR